MSNKEWKPATSPGDLAVRLENGELFNHHGDKVWYDPTKLCPFRYRNDPLEAAWKYYAHMTQWVEPVPEWTKQLDKVNVWCRVSNTSREVALKNYSVMLIIDYKEGDDFPYIDKGEYGWKFAIPLKNLTEPKE